MIATDQSIIEHAGRYDFDLPHCLQVASIAQGLFDDCREMHGLGPRERDMLVFASILHDIGWSDGPSHHHKRARDLILADPPAGLTVREVGVIANVARYHTRSLPKDSHKHFSRLDRQDQCLVRRLAAILRIADGLDAGHCGAVSYRRAAVCDGELLVELDAEYDCPEELAAAFRKANLFEEVFGLPVRFNATDPALEPARSLA